MVWKNYVLRSTFHKNRNQFADDWVRRSSTNQAAHLMMKGIVRAATMRTRRMAGLGGVALFGYDHEWLRLSAWLRFVRRHHTSSSHEMKTRKLKGDCRGVKKIQQQRWQRRIAMEELRLNKSFT